MKELKQLRTEIDKIDDELISLLCKRFSVVKKVAIFKQKDNEYCFIKADREASLLKDLLQKNLNFPKILIYNIWRNIISFSLQTEKKFKIYNLAGSISNNFIIREYFSNFTEIKNVSVNNLPNIDNNDVFVFHKEQKEVLKYLINNREYKIFALLPRIEKKEIKKSDYFAFAKIKKDFLAKENILYIDQDTYSIIDSKQQIAKASEGKIFVGSYNFL